MRAVILFALCLTCAACSDGPAGSGDAGKKPSLSKGADDFMKVYGGVESGVTEDKPKEQKEPK